MMALSPLDKCPAEAQWTPSFNVAGTMRFVPSPARPISATGRRRLTAASWMELGAPHIFPDAIVLMFILFKKKLTVHVQLQLARVVLPDADPSISTGCDLLEVDQIVSGRAVSVVVELETIAAQPCGRRAIHHQMPPRSNVTRKKRR